MRTAGRFLLGCCIFMACSGSAAASQFQAHPFYEAVPSADSAYHADRISSVWIDESKIRLGQAAMVFNPFVAKFAVLLGVQVQEHFFVKGITGGTPNKLSERRNDVLPALYILLIGFVILLFFNDKEHYPQRFKSIIKTITIIVMVCAGGYMALFFVALEFPDMCEKVQDWAALAGFEVAISCPRDEPCMPNCHFFEQ